MPEEKYILSIFGRLRLRINSHHQKYLLIVLKHSENLLQTFLPLNSQEYFVLQSILDLHALLLCLWKIYQLLTEKKKKCILAWLTCRDMELSRVSESTHSDMHTWYAIKISIHIPTGLSIKRKAFLTTSSEAYQLTAEQELKQ